MNNEYMNYTGEKLNRAYVDDYLIKLDYKVLNGLLLDEEDVKFIVNYRSHIKQVGGSTDTRKEILTVFPIITKHGDVDTYSVYWYESTTPKYPSSFPQQVAARVYQQVKTISKWVYIDE